METFTPLIITAKKARKDFERIKAHSQEIIQRNKDHAVRVAGYHEKLKTERTARLQMESESRRVAAEQESKRKESQMAHEKEMMAHQEKLKELEIKRAALHG